VRGANWGGSLDSEFTRALARLRLYDVCKVGLFDP